MEKVLDRAEAKIVRLARGFPCLLNAPGIEPWNANRLDDWARRTESWRKVLGKVHPGRLESQPRVAVGQV